MTDWNYLRNRYCIGNFIDDNIVEDPAEYDLFWNSGTIHPLEEKTFEIYSGRFELFRPTSLHAVISTSIDYVKYATNINEIKDNNLYFEIINVVIMGMPQLINFEGSTVSLNRGSFAFYNLPTKIDWMAFSNVKNNGLHLSIKNTSNVSAVLYLNFKGKRPINKQGTHFKSPSWEDAIKDENEGN